MATFHYTLIIQEAEPTNPNNGWFWLKESTGQMYAYINGAWIPFAAGAPA